MRSNTIVQTVLYRSASPRARKASDPCFRYGTGIPEEYQQSIFQPFFRVDKSRSRTFGGAGLGLALVWEIAALHGGSVRVAESSDSGTTIAAELPRSGNHEADFTKNEMLYENQNEQK